MTGCGRRAESGQGALGRGPLVTEYVYGLR